MPDISSIEYLTKLKNHSYSKSIWIQKSTYSASMAIGRTSCAIGGDSMAIAGLPRLSAAPP
jgi:hypothetical protein